MNAGKGSGKTPVPTKQYENQLHEETGLPRPQSLHPSLSPPPVGLRKEDAKATHSHPTQTQNPQAGEGLQGGSTFGNVCDLSGVWEREGGQYPRLKRPVPVKVRRSRQPVTEDIKAGPAHQYHPTLAGILSPSQQEVVPTGKGDCSFHAPQQPPLPLGLCQVIWLLP
jgi:hypothetical protein